MKIFFIIQAKSFLKKFFQNKWKPLAGFKNSVKLREQIIPAGLGAFFNPHVF